MVAMDHEHWYGYIVVWIFVVHHRKSEGITPIKLRPTYIICIQHAQTYYPYTIVLKVRHLVSGSAVCWD